MDGAVGDVLLFRLRVVFFFNDTATAEIYTLSLHDALPISPAPASGGIGSGTRSGCTGLANPPSWQVRATASPPPKPTPSSYPSRTDPRRSSPAPLRPTAPPAPAPTPSHPPPCHTDRPHDPHGTRATPPAASLSA